MKTLKIFLVDDHQILLDGIKSLLQSNEQFQIIGEATRAKNALEKLEHEVPDILITDIQMPEMSGIELTRLIRTKFPQVKILALSMSGDEGEIIAMIEAGISGYVLKNTGKEELTDALIRISEGDLFYSREVSAKLSNALRRRGEIDDELKAINLTPREKEIVKLVVKEYTNKKIAEALFISERTVETHRKNIFRKTGCQSVLGLLKWAQQHGLA